MTIIPALHRLRRRAARDLLTSSGARRNAGEAAAAARRRRLEHEAAGDAVRQAELVVARRARTRPAA